MKGSSSVNFTYNYRRFGIYLYVFIIIVFIFFFLSFWVFFFFWNVMKIFLWKYNEKTLKIRSQLFYIRFCNFGFLIPILF